MIWELGSGMPHDQTRTLPILAAQDGPSLSISADGRLIAFAVRETSGSAVCVLDSASSRLGARLECGDAIAFGAASFDKGSRRLAIVGILPGGKRTILSWDLRTSERARIPGPSKKERCSSSRRLEARSSSRVAKAVVPRLMEVGTGQFLVELDGPALRRAVADRALRFLRRRPCFRRSNQKRPRCVMGVEDRPRTGDMRWPGRLRRIALGPKGSHLAALSDHGRLVIFDRSTRRSQVLKSASSRVVKLHALSFSDDEKLLAVGQETAGGGPEAPEVWDVATGQQVAVFSGRSFGPNVVFLPRSRALVLSDGTRPRIWRPNPPAKPDALPESRAETWSASFSRDGNILAIGSDDTNECRTIKLCDPRSGRIKAGWKAHTATVSALALGPDGRLLASGSLDSGEKTNPNLMLWDTVSHERVANLVGHTGSVRSVAFSPDGKMLATAGDDAKIRLWDVAKAAPLATLTGHAAKLMAVAFSPNGRMLASASCDATVRLWDLATRQCRKTLSDIGNVNAVAFRPDGTMLGSANEEGQIKLWDPATGDLLRTIRGDSDQLRSLVFTIDGRNVAAAGKGAVTRFWDVVTGQELLTLEGHKAQINSLSFSPDGSVLASCSHDGSVRLWRADPVAALPAR